MKVALVHDWLFGIRGGEKCLEELVRMFPEADVYTLFYRHKRISPLLNRMRIQSSFLNGLPGVERYYRLLLPLFPLGVWHLSRLLNRERYDLVVSVSHCVVKNIQAQPGTPHLCYCLTPARYFWDQFEQYFAGSALRPLIAWVIGFLRRWDCRAAAPGTRFVAISKFIQARIKRTLGVDSSVVYPPVSAQWFQGQTPKEPGKYFLCVNALVPYKRVDLIVRAFNQLGLPLIIVGDGPERKSLERLAGKNIKFINYLDDASLAGTYREAKALVFAAEEDFGIIPVEIQAVGRPVICYAAGGALETVVKGVTGVYFSKPDEESLCNAVSDFLAKERQISGDVCRENARKFSSEQFCRGIFTELAALPGISGLLRPSETLLPEMEVSSTVSQRGAKHVLEPHPLGVGGSPDQSNDQRF